MNKLKIIKSNLELQLIEKLKNRLSDRENAIKAELNISSITNKKNNNS